MKNVLNILVFLTAVCGNSTAQDIVNGYNRLEKGCMTLSSEKSNIVLLNDTTYIDYHFNGYRLNQLTLKGDSAVHVIIQKGKSPGIVPIKDTFELSIHNKATDELLYSQKFIAVNPESLSSTQNTLNGDLEFCDYIFSRTTTSNLYRSVPNRLVLRTNNYDTSLITFTAENGVIISDSVDNLIVQPGKGRLFEISVYYDGILYLSKQFLIVD